MTTPAGFEPARAEPNGLAGRRLNHSAKVSLSTCDLAAQFWVYVSKKSQQGKTVCMYVGSYLSIDAANRDKLDIVEELIV